MLKPKITFVYCVNSTGEEDIKKFNVANMKTRSGKETAALKGNSRLWQTIREKTAC